MSAPAKNTTLVGGSNLTDKRVLNQVTNSAFFPDTYYAQPAAGRQVLRSCR